MHPQIPLYISAVFIVLTLALFYLFMNGFKYALDRTRYLNEKKNRIFLLVPTAVVIWLILTALFAFFGFFNDFSALPPRVFLIVAPMFIFIAVIVFSGAIDIFLLSVRPTWLINMQSFRILVEVILWLLYIYHIAPVQMTFEGRNYDVLVGLSAPLIAYLGFRKGSSNYMVGLIWNLCGLALLFNIVVISVLSSPGKLRYFMNEPANTFVTYYPYIWLPGFLVPLALFLHLASIRQLILKARYGGKRKESAW